MIERKSFELTELSSIGKIGNASSRMKQTENLRDKIWSNEYPICIERDGGPWN